MGDPGDENNVRGSVVFRTGGYGMIDAFINTITAWALRADLTTMIIVVIIVVLVVSFVQRG
jgi:hypothetical protein